MRLVEALLDDLVGAEGRTTIAGGVVAIVALFAGVADAIATDDDGAIVATAISFGGVAVVARFTQRGLSDSVSAFFYLAGRAATVTGDIASVVALFRALIDAVVAAPDFSHALRTTTITTLVSAVVALFTPR